MIEEFAKKKDKGTSPIEAARMMKLGADIERRAMGEATTKTEITVRVYTELLYEIRGLFLAANDLPDAEARARQFALGVDGLVDAHISGIPADLREGGGAEDGQEDAGSGDAADATAPFE